MGNNNRSNVESSETDDLFKWIMDDTQIANFAFPDEVEEATTSFLIQEVKAEEETEIAILQQKNIQLQAVLKDMEKEVASYKKRILEQVSGVRNRSSRVLKKETHN